MIVDSHTHLGRNNHITAGAEALVRSMNKAGIDKSLVFAGRLNDCDNSWMMEQIKPYKDRLYGVASVHLPLIHGQYRWLTGSKEDMSLDGMLDTLHAGAVGLKIYTGYEHYAPNSETVRHVLNVMNGLNKTVIFHMGDCLSSVHAAKLKYAQPLDVDDIAVDYPNINFVIAHLGYPWQRETAEVCYKNKNVYTDISGFVYGDFSSLDQLKFKKVINEFLDICDSSKLLFGTDFPISNQKSYIDTLDNMYGEALTAQYLTRNTLSIFDLK